MLIKISSFYRKHLNKCLKDPEIAGYFLQTIMEDASRRKNKTLLISTLINIAVANKIKLDDLINQMPRKTESRANKKAPFAVRRSRLDKNRPQLKKVKK